jgi:hypothetical protein
MGLIELKAFLSMGPILSTNSSNLSNRITPIGLPKNFIPNLTLICLSALQKEGISKLWRAVYYKKIEETRCAFSWINQRSQYQGYCLEISTLHLVENGLKRFENNPASSYLSAPPNKCRITILKSTIL